MATPFEVADAARARIADLLDLQLSPLGLPAIDALAPTHGQTILDVGCGAGETVGQLAERVGESGRVIGVDLGAQSLAVARSRTAHLPQVTLMHNDAAALDLPDHSVDGVFSRFGVMFFEHPVAAFANLRRMMRPGGRLSFVCWRALHENELDIVPLQAANLDIAADDAPFSFERPEVIEDVLGEAGFGNVAVRKFDASVSSGNVDAMLQVVTTVGALGKILRETPSLIDDVRPRVRAALLTRQTDMEVRLSAATWIVTATAE